jgi:hypothetical protein
MGNQYGEWIADVERPAGNTGGGDTSDSFIFTDISKTGKGGAANGGWDWEVEAETSWTKGGGRLDTPVIGCDFHASLPAVQMGESYAESHALYQDLIVPQ